MEGVGAKEVRGQKVNFEDFTGVIFTSKVAADHFFRVAELIRYEIPDSLKYFCISEAIALYLQNMLSIEKERFFMGNKILLTLLK